MTTQHAAPRPLIVAYGMGVDSTAMLVGMHARGIRPDLILFADTGSEKPETYAYLPVIQAWLRSVGFPEVIVVRYVVQNPRNGFYSSLEENCLVNATLPSLAFGFKKCSLKWKREPQDKWCRTWQPAIDAWARGDKCVKAIGYDAGPVDSKRAWSLTDDDEYTYWYPLRDWGWDRERCKQEIVSAGLPVPMKSACFFCPASKPSEIAWLVDAHPELADRIVEMERRAAPNNTKIEGLWRKPVKGLDGKGRPNGKVPHPGSMTEYIVARRRLNVIQDPPPTDGPPCGY